MAGLVATRDRATQHVPPVKVGDKVRVKVRSRSKSESRSESESVSGMHGVRGSGSESDSESYPGRGRGQGQVQGQLSRSSRLETVAVRRASLCNPHDAKTTTW